MYWNKQRYETFCDLAMLPEFERNLLKARIEKRSYIQQQQMFGLSEPQIKKKMAEIKAIYDEVQPLAPEILPKRLPTGQSKYDVKNKDLLFF